MLVHLSIQDLALVERLELELGPGLNVLTGETGAGKSVLIGALSLVLGARSSAERATVEPDAEPFYASAPCMRGLRSPGRAGSSRPGRPRSPRLASP